MDDSGLPRAAEVLGAIFCFQRDMCLGLRNGDID